MEFMRRMRKRMVKNSEGRRFASHGMKEAPKTDPAKLGSFAPSANTTPSRVDLRKWCSPVENQSQSNSCCANAAVGAYEYLCCRDAESKGDTPGDVSRLFVYYVGRLRDKQRWKDNSPISDEGLSISGAIDALSMKGACLAETWPFELSNVNSKPNDEAYDQAMRYKISQASEVPVDETAMKACLASGFPIIFGLKLTKKFFTPGSSGVIQTPDPEDPKSASHGLHAMLIVGYSDRDRCFIVRNSWGEDWGDKGYCYIPYDYAANPEFNYCGQYVIYSLTDTDFTPEEADDSEPLVEGETTEVEEDIESDEEDLEPGDEVDQDLDELFNPVNEARKAFDKFDRDGSGELDLRELFQALLLNGTFYPPFRLKQVMRKFDEDGSGTLSFEEFIKLPGVIPTEYGGVDYN